MWKGPHPPRNRGSSKYSNTKQMEAPFKGIYMGEKVAEEFKVRGAQEGHRKC